MADDTFHDDAFYRVSTCQACGAEFESLARFCRRCGSLRGSEWPSMSTLEATTRSLDLGEIVPGSKQPGSPRTWPAYLAPQRAGTATTKLRGGRKVGTCLRWC